MSGERTRAAQPPVLATVEGHAGRLVLNRPSAINALTHEMVGLIADALLQWATDDRVQHVVLTGCGDRGLCAGGDIVAIHRDALSGGTGSVDFWHDEYLLNALISEYPKPFIAVMDGIVLGGGIGLSAHADVRIVTERSSVGMPEAGIGFFPDVGGTWLLSKAPGELGTYLALTAGSVAAGDAIVVGLADHYVPSDRLSDLLHALTTTDATAAVRQFAQWAPQSELAGRREWVDACFAHDAPLDILAALRDHATPEAANAAERIERRSPTSVAVTLAALRAAGSMTSLRQALIQEFRLCQRFLRAHDLAEGIRAQVIDKDRKPTWEPRDLKGVTAEQVAAFFAPPTADERPDLQFPNDFSHSSQPTTTNQGAPR